MSNLNPTGNKQTIEALLELSGISSQKYYDRMVNVIEKAPDPETVCQVFTDEFQLTGVLEEKWRKVITQTWHSQHIKAAYPMEIPLTSREVLETPAMADALGLLDELFVRPAAYVKQEKEMVFAPEELQRLVASMPSLRGRFNDMPEHEWGIPRLTRLRQVLQTLKLIRPFKGKMVVVKSRFTAFEDLPFPQRFYLLWHTDVYHVRWSQFASSWSSHVDVMQEYVPLMWDLARGTRAGQIQTTADMTFALLDGYQGLWEGAGLVATDGDPQTLLDLYHESALPVVVEQLLVRDVFAKYGLIEAAEGLAALVQGAGQMFLNNTGVVRWTNIGEAILKLEQSGDLPCGLDMLD